MSFRTTILGAMKSATGIVVPDEVVARLGSGKKPAVRVTINGHTYRSTVAVISGRFMVRVSAAERVNAGVAAGDEVEVTLELDTSPRQVEVPDDLSAALSSDPLAMAFWSTLSYSNQRWYVLWITGTKQQVTRDARVAKAIGMLRDGRKQG
ncbi:MAG TPA: hypothetical protein DCP73_15940 [Chloroflexi bacterium]|nr:hypothetical protein [Chloroflexota bacterium]